MAASNDLGLSSYSAEQPFWQLSVYAKHVEGSVWKAHLGRRTGGASGLAGSWVGRWA